MNLEPHRPVEHQQVIALLKEAKEPPADADTPGIPDEVLERLRGQYGRAKRRVIVEEKPGFWAAFLDLFVQPKFAFATALVLLCGVAVFMLQSPAPENKAMTSVTDMMRGGKSITAALPCYWLQSDQAEPAPSGLGLPKFIIITPHDTPPMKAGALIFDPAHREARLMREGKVTAQIQISDPTDSNEWLVAHRQLSKLSSL